MFGISETAVDLQGINTGDLLQSPLSYEQQDHIMEEYKEAHIVDQNWVHSEDPHLTTIPDAIKPAPIITQEWVQSGEPHLSRIPDLLKVETDYKFEVTINGDNNNWLYVPALEKIFIKMSSTMNINISYIPPPQGSQLYLRAMILFSNTDQMHLPVKRCANHRESDSKDNHVLNHHILRCLHPSSFYRGFEDGLFFQDRLCAMVPLCSPTNEDGLAQEAIGLEFVCQNSCTSGINRRSTSIMFTLEEHTGKLVGKRVVQFKVCSCPKRDAEREMPEQLKRKPSGAQSHPRGKKPKYQVTLENTEIKTEPVDSPPEPVPSPSPPGAGEVTLTLTMPNAEAMRHVLECAFNKIAGVMASDPDNSEKYIRLLKQTGKLRDAYTPT